MPQHFDLIETAFNAMKFFIPFLFALCFHEYAHGFVARLRGDRTAEMMGRLTLNPMAHADPIGTFFLPLLAVITSIPLFGWAKPVPVDERNFKNPRTDMFWVALAGPASNLLLAIVGALAAGAFFVYFRAGISAEEKGLITIFEILQMFIMVNVALMFFNLVPLHPLDGAKVLARFLPARWNQKLEDIQHISGLVLMMLFFVGGARFIAGPTIWLASVLYGISEKAFFVILGKGIL